MWGVSICIWSQKTEFSGKIPLICVFGWVFQSPFHVAYPALQTCPYLSPWEVQSAASCQTSSSTSSIQSAPAFGRVPCSLQSPASHLTVTLCFLLVFPFSCWWDLFPFWSLSISLNNSTVTSEVFIFSTVVYGLSLKTPAPHSSDFYLFYLFSFFFST